MPYSVLTRKRRTRLLSFLFYVQITHRARLPVTLIHHPPLSSSPSWTNLTDEVSRSRADQLAVGRIRADPRGMVPSTGSYLFGRDILGRPFPYLEHLLIKLVSALKRKIQTLRPLILLNHLPMGYQVLMLYQLFQFPDHTAHLKHRNRQIRALVPPPPLHMHPLLPCHKVISLFLLLQLTIVIILCECETCTRSFFCTYKSQKCAARCQCPIPRCP